MSTPPTIVPLEEILSPISDDLKKVEQLLLQNMKTEIPLLSEVGRYILKSGGKRIRPALLILAAGAVGSVTESAHIAANVIEYLHTATLLHDDVVDNADLRRSQKSARTIWGNEASVLVGDYLFGFAFQNLAALQSLRLIDILSNTSTLMARGEIRQLTRNNQITSEADYLDIIYYKTASLMEAAMQIGCILGGGSTSDEEAMRVCGRNIGMAFQLVDDALDYDIRNLELGKQAGVDLKERKITMPLSRLMDIATSSEADEVRRILSGFEITDDHVRRVSGLIGHYETDAYTRNQAAMYAERAKETLRPITISRYRTSIEQLADFIVFRNK